MSALSLHQHEGSHVVVKNISVNLWDTLRRTFIMMERRELAEKAVTGADVEQFRSEFDF